MKEIRKAIDFYKARVRSSMIGFPLFILLMFVLAIVNLIYLPQIWWLSLILFGFAIVGVICFIYFIRSTNKKLKELEKELEEAEHQTKNSNYRGDV